MGWHYLDHAASTPMRPAAVAAMGPVLREVYANPTGAHALARHARGVLDDGRERLAAVVGCRPGELVFTSGGTEADNLAVLGAVAARPGTTAVCAAVEHHAVLRAVEQVGGRTAPVDRRGLVDLDALAATLGPDVALVSVGLVNNETGVVQPLDAIAAVVRQHAPGALLHTDAAQALCWLDVAAHTTCADLVTLASHKCGGPRGIGALVVRDGAQVRPQQVGGGQERDRRAGTQDVAGAIALAVAAEEAATDRPRLVADASAWRDRVVAAALEVVPGAVESAAPDGDRSHLVAGIANVCLPGVDSEALLYLLEHEHHVLASAGSSCASGAQEPSHVLAALGLDRTLARGSIRVSLGWPTTEADVGAAVAGIPAAARRLQAHIRDGAPA